MKKAPQPKLAMTSVSKAVEALLRTGARKAIVLQHPNLAVTATRRFRLDRRSRTTDIVLTIGKPNYAMRRFVKSALAAKEPFPIKRVLLRFWPS